VRGDKGLLEEEDCVGTWVTNARNEWGGATIDGVGARFGPPSTAQEFDLVRRRPRRRRRRKIERRRNKRW